MDFLDFSSVAYSGQQLNNEPHGEGVMKFPGGQTYKGTFQTGEFHGSGELLFEQGKIIGQWEHGRLMTYQVVFRDQLEFQEGQWDYITPNDRRFYNEKTGAVPVAAFREKPGQYQTEKDMVKRE